MSDDQGPFHKQSRYLHVSEMGRRAFMRSAMLAAAGAIVAACSQDDASVFNETAQSDALAGADASTGGNDAPTLRVDVDPNAAPTGQVADGSVSSTAAPESSTTSEAPQSTTTTAAPESTTTAAPSTGGALPAGSEMVVAFTYEQQPGGKNVPPYIAVWIENGDGELMTTVALWYQQFGRGERWLPDLRRWYNVDQNRITGGGADTVAAISGPTRNPGGYQVVWNGTANGSAVPPGNYFVCIESARERGPYSLIREQLTLASADVQRALAGDGELIDATVTVA